LSHSNSLAILPSIYDAAASSRIWGDTLEKSAHHIGAKGALLLIIDQRDNKPFQVNHFSNIWTRAPERTKMYNERFGHYEKPVWDKLFSMPKQNLILDTEFWKDESDLLNRPDYRYLSDEVGIVHKCAARLNDNMSWWDTLVVHFDKTLSKIPNQSVQHIQQILPHVAKSIELSRAFDILKSQYNAVLAALDHVEVGMCIAASSGDIIVSNAEANRILDEKDGIKLSANKQLCCGDDERNAELLEAIQQTSRTASGEDNTHELLFTSDRRSGKSPILVEVAPLRDYAEEIERDYSGALVTLIDPSNSKPFNVERVIAAYKLSKIEGTVCKLLVEGHTYPEMADIRNVSPETIKTQVRAVLQKTA